MLSDAGPFEFECDRCGEGSGMLGHLRSDGTWACRMPALLDWQDGFDSLFAVMSLPEGVVPYDDFEISEPLAVIDIPLP